MKHLLNAIVIAAGLLTTLPAWGVALDRDALKDPAQEAQAQAIMKDLRCLVCQNQSIELSNADLAHDLRTIVREQVAAGKSEREIKDFMVSRYGDWVLLKPPFKPETYLLWFFPALVFLVAIVSAVLIARRRRQVVNAERLSPEEERQIAEMLGPREGT